MEGALPFSSLTPYLFMNMALVYLRPKYAASSIVVHQIMAGIFRCSSPG